MGRSRNRRKGLIRASRWSPLICCLLITGMVGSVVVQSGVGGSAVPNWSIVPSPNPTTESFLQDVSCVSSTSCTAVGYSYNGTSSQTLVESWDGTIWSIVPSPNPSGSTISVLQGVSCLSSADPTDCTAVGYSYNGTIRQTLIESWNGSAWSIIPSPNPSGRVVSSLQGVSCVGSTECMVVGVSCLRPADCTEGDNTGGAFTLVESWDGSAWSIIPSPNPISDGEASIFSGVSCLSPTHCTAVGTSYKGSTPWTQTLVESWNGSTWSIVPSPNPSGSSGGSYLESASCVRSTGCTVVGYYDNSSGDQLTLIESWNGSAWSIIPNPSLFGSLDAVACPSADRCTTVGSLVESWDGATWSIVPSPNVTGNDSTLSGVSIWL